MQKTNNPNDLDHTGPQVGAPGSSQLPRGVEPRSGAAVYNAKGPYIPDQAYLANVEPPKVSVSSRVLTAVDANKRRL